MHTLYTTSSQLHRHVMLPALPEQAELGLGLAFVLGAHQVRGSLVCLPAVDHAAVEEVGQGRGDADQDAACAPILSAP